MRCSGKDHHHEDLLIIQSIQEKSEMWLLYRRLLYHWNLHLYDFPQYRKMIIISFIFEKRTIAVFISCNELFLSWRTNNLDFNMHLFNKILQANDGPDPVIGSRQMHAAEFHWLPWDFPKARGHVVESHGSQCGSLWGQRFAHPQPTESSEVM